MSNNDLIRTTALGKLSKACTLALFSALLSTLVCACASADPLASSESDLGLLEALRGPSDGIDAVPAHLRGVVTLRGTVEVESSSIGPTRDNWFPTGEDFRCEEKGSKSTLYDCSLQGIFYGSPELPITFQVTDGNCAGFFNSDEVDISRPLGSYPIIGVRLPIVRNAAMTQEGNFAIGISNEALFIDWDVGTALPTCSDPAFLDDPAAEEIYSVKSSRRLRFTLSQ